MADTRKPKPDRHWGNPNFRAATIVSLARRAGEGDRDANEQLTDVLARYPDLKPSVADLRDLATRAEDLWVAMLSGDNLVIEKSLRDEIAGMRAELLGEEPTLVDRLLTGAVVTAHLAHQAAVAASARPAATSGIEAHRNRRAEATQRRLVAATRAWERHQRAKATGHAPPAKLKLFRAAV
jgi:hypothetical protein